MESNKIMNGEEVKVKTIEYKGQMVYVGKHGYYEYDYETFRKLKFLNKCLKKAEKKAAQWYRWARKDSSNRVQRIYKRDENGRKIGVEKTIPISEPEFDSADKMFIQFADKYPVSNWSAYHRSHKTLWFETDKNRKLEFTKHSTIPWLKIPTNANYYYYYFYSNNHDKVIIVNTMGIDRIYKNARKPKTLEEIKATEISAEEINKLYQMAQYEAGFDSWIKNQKSD